MKWYETPEWREVCALALDEPLTDRTIAQVAVSADRRILGEQIRAMEIPANDCEGIYRAVLALIEAGEVGV